MTTKFKAIKSLLSILSLITLAGCDFLTIETAPSKHASANRTETALNADTLFWQVFHEGAYHRIDEALNAQTAAYLTDPNDPITAAHVGWLHMWHLSERARLRPVPATITDDAVLAQHYFGQAVALDPNDARYLGFLASAKLIVGKINNDEKTTREGFVTLKHAIKAWPEFNLFTAGYVMSPQPAESVRFQEGLAWQWDNLDACAEATLDRHNPDFKPYLNPKTQQAPKRVCWNSAIAPHNFEGFFLNMGDMVVKSGDWALAQKIYANAKLSAHYEDWKYKAVLEERIKDAQANVANFNAVPQPNTLPEHPMMIASAFACMGCHQN